MSNIKVIMRNGDVAELELVAGISLMEAIRDAGIDELLALCGGSCSCGTCHIHVDPEFLSKLPDMAEHENDLLDFSEHRNETSRLSCQIPLTKDLAGLRVRVAAED